MDATSLALKYIPFFEYFAFGSITHNENVVGHEVLLISNGKTLGGGTAKQSSTATQIALAEALERTTIALATDKELDRVLFDQYPTSCGFAAGFDEQTTKMRSICEANERWCWEQWIDKKYKLNQLTDVSLSELSRYSLSFFDQALFYEKEFLIFADTVSFTLKFNVVLGLKGNGIFPGSRVTAKADDGWEHAAVEALRHLKIFENELADTSPSDFIDARIKFFGNNRKLALNIVDSANNVNWPSSNILFSKKLTTPAEYFVYRTICKNFKGWHTGNESRFIY